MRKRRLARATWPGMPRGARYQIGVRARAAWCWARLGRGLAPNAAVVVTLHDKLYESGALLPVSGPIPVTQWVAITTAIQDPNGVDVMLAPFDGVIRRGPCRGGRVIEVDIDVRYYFAVTKAALPALQGLLPSEQYALALAGAVWAPEIPTLPPPRRHPRPALEPDPDAPRYPMHIAWDAAADHYVAMVPALAGCTATGRSYAEAATAGQVAVTRWLEAARAHGTALPPSL